MDPIIVLTRQNYLHLEFGSHGLLHCKIECKKIKKIKNMVLYISLVAVANLGSGCAIKTSYLEVGTSELDTASTSTM